MHYIYAMKNNVPLELIKEYDFNNYDKNVIKDIIKYTANYWYWEYFEHYKGNEYSVLITKEKLIKEKIHTKNLFQQIEFYGLNREQAWDKALMLGYKWSVLEGVWIK